MLPEWQMLSEVFNRVHFSGEISYFADCFASEASLNTQIIYDF